MMRILLLGGRGLVGSALRAHWGSAAHCPTHEELDISDLPAVRQAVADSGAELVINAAAQAHVDRAEQDPDQAFRSNAIGPHNLALAAAEAGVPLLHFSSDYVFDGAAGRPYREVDPTGLPPSQYGQSKLLGEQLVRGTWPRHYIVRIAGVFGPGRKGFVDWVIDTADPAKPLRIVDDRLVSPTFTADLARQVEVLTASGCFGTYHATCHGAASWHELAREALVTSGRDPGGIIAVSDAALGLGGAPRPAFSVLDNHLLRLRALDVMRPWQEALADYLRSHGDQNHLP